MRRLKSGKAPSTTSRRGADGAEGFSFFGLLLILLSYKLVSFGHQVQTVGDSLTIQFG